MKRARRALLLCFAVGIVISMIAMFTTARTLSSDESRTEATAEVLGLTFFRATRTRDEDSSSVTLRPGPGVILVLGFLPCAAAAAVYFRDRRRQPA